MRHPTPPRWDLSHLYKSPDDAGIARDLERATKMADDFAARFRGKVAQLSPADLAAALVETEALMDVAYRPPMYASLLHSTQSDDPKAMALYVEAQEKTTDVFNRVQFFDVELKRAPDDVFARWLAAPALAGYAHYLRRVRKSAPHTLSEAEEQLSAIKNLTGRSAWARLYDEITSSWTFEFDADGEKKTRSLAEIRALRSHADRDVRKRAQAAVLDKHAQHAQVLTYLTNTIFQDHKLETDLRKFPDVLAPTALDDEIPAPVIETLMSSVEERYPVVHEYYRLKARALGLGDFATYDLLAPYSESERQVSFADAQKLVLESFAQVAPPFADAARAFFDERRIDAEPRPGKRDGAFCAGMLPGLPPYVLANYTGRLDDVSTVAHELGHGVHFVLAGRKQSALNYWPTTPMAETASVFGEMVLVRNLLAAEKDPATRRQLLASRIEDSIATIFRQVAYTRYELNAHIRRQEGVVPPDDYSGLWSTEMKRLYGDSVRQGDIDRWGWITIPHLVHHRFYCYSYAFGQLLVYALYRQWEREGDAFVPRYIELLEAGGSDEPAVLAKKAGCAIDDAAFWRAGLDIFQRMVEEFAAAV
jgi:oligoendopeptidase F